MFPKSETITKWTLNSYSLNDAYTDFVLSRQATRCVPATIQFYNFTAGKFILWLQSQSITKPEEVQSRLVRMYLAELISNGKSPMTVQDHARGIRVLLRFWHSEKYLPELIKVDMPKVDKKRQLVLSPEHVTKVLSVCSTRDKAIILLMVDTGLRRSEIVALNWNDLDMATGLTRVIRGKGGKARSVIVGATTRRSLLAYRRTLPDVKDTSPLIQTKGSRLTGIGLLQIFRRLSVKSGIKITPHSLRRTFCILSLRAGMDVLHLQALGGWSSLDMVQHYAQMENVDLIEAHQAHSPVDNLSRL